MRRILEEDRDPFIVEVLVSSHTLGPSQPQASPTEKVGVCERGSRSQTFLPTPRSGALLWAVCCLCLTLGTDTTGRARIGLWLQGMKIAGENQATKPSGSQNDRGGVGPPQKKPPLAAPAQN